MAENHCQESFCKFPWRRASLKSHDMVITALMTLYDILLPSSGHETNFKSCSNSAFIFHVYEHICNIKQCMGDTITFKVILSLGRGGQELGGCKRDNFCMCSSFLLYIFLKDLKLTYQNVWDFHGGPVVKNVLQCRG